MAGAGTMLSWAMTFFILLPLLMLLPTKIKTKKTSIESTAVNPFAQKSADFIFSYRKSILIFFSVICVAAGYWASKVEVNSDPFEYFDPAYSLSIANHYMEDNVGGSIGAEIVIESGQKESKVKRKAK